MSDVMPPTGETAIVIVPPRDVCGFADHYRRLYMPDTMHRIEPHITVTYPFVPFDELPEAAPKLLEALANEPPRPVSLRGFSTFPGEEAILYLRLADNERVLSIYRAILKVFPDYQAYGGKFGDGFIPHMTVGEFKSREELERVHSGLAIQRLFIAFDVDEVHLKHKTAADVWETWARVPLGAGLA